MKSPKWQALRRRIRLPGEMTLEQEYRYLISTGEAYTGHPSPLFHVNLAVKLDGIDESKHPRRSAMLFGLLFGSGSRDFADRGVVAVPYRRYHDVGCALGQPIRLYLWIRYTRERKLNKALPRQLREQGGGQ